MKYCRIGRYQKNCVGITWGCSFFLIIHITSGNHGSNVFIKCQIREGNVVEFSEFSTSHVYVYISAIRYCKNFSHIIWMSWRHCRWYGSFCSVYVIYIWNWINQRNCPEQVEKFFSVCLTSGNHNSKLKCENPFRLKGKHTDGMKIFTRCSFYRDKLVSKWNHYQKRYKVRKMSK